MKINRQAVQSICCAAWGISPVKMREMMRAGEIKMGDVLNQVMLEAMRNPMSAEALIEWVMPGAKAMRRREKQQAEMLVSLKRVAQAQGLVKKDG